MCPGPIVVVGSINEDLHVVQHRRPLPGETVLGLSVSRKAGGKGANQAVAAAAAGAQVVMIGAVGGDEVGQRQIAELARHHIDVTDVRVIHELPTGLALISTTPDGENSITVILGANETLGASAIRGVLGRGVRPSLVIAQTEAGKDAAEAAAELARTTGARLIVNAGPVVSLTRETWLLADPLVVNQHEAADLMGAGETPSAAALRTHLGCRSVVVTLGAQGCQVADDSGVRVFAAPSVRTVDTTGAGDTFVGALADRLHRGFTLDESVLAATAAAAAAVTWSGARPDQASLAYGVTRMPVRSKETA